MTPFHRLLPLLLLAVALADARLAPATTAQQPAHAVAEPPAPQPSAAVRPLLDQAARYETDRQFPEALQSAEQALTAAGAAKDAPGEAMAHGARARALERLTRTEDAIAAWRAAGAAWERAGDGPGRIEALAQAGALLAATQPPEAEALVGQAVAVGQAEARRPLAAARALHAAANASHSRRQTAQARELWAAALVIRERVAPDSLDLVGNLSNLGVAARTLGDPAAAQAYLERALAIAERVAPVSAEAAATLRNLGNVAKDRGDLAAARAYHQRALALREKLDPNSLQLARNLTDLAGVLREQGDLVAAKAYYERALALDEKLAPHSTWVAYSLSVLGNVASQQKDWMAAKAYHQRALALNERLAPNSPNVASSLYGLGTVAIEQADTAAAQAYFQRALALYDEAAPNSRSVANSLNSLGWVAGEQRDLGTAKGYFQRALDLQEKLAPNSRDVAWSLNNLGEVAGLQGDLGAAWGYFQRARAIWEKRHPGSLELAVSFSNLGWVASRQGKWTEAERWGRRAWEIVRRQAGEITGDEARQAFGASTTRYAARLLRAQIALGHRAAAWTTLEEGRARALQQLLLERRLDISAAPTALRVGHQAAVDTRNQTEQAVSEASVSAARARRELAAAREAKAPAEALAGKQAAVETAVRALEEAQFADTRARARADQLWAQIRQSAPRAAAPPLSLEQAQQVVPPDALFVAYAVGEEQTHLLLLQPGAPRRSPRLRVPAGPLLSVYTLAGTPAELGRRIRDARRRWIDPETEAREAVAASRALFERLFPPAARRQIQRARRLLISPDGPLWEVPFAALVTNVQGLPRYLGAESAITYTQSLTLFAQSQRDAPRPAKGGALTAVVVGNPRFGRVPAQLASASTGGPAVRGERGSLLRNEIPPAPLPGTAKEAAEIVRLYGGKPLLAASATEAALRGRLPGADVVHLATHGYLHPLRAMSSGVLLAAPAKEPEIGETTDDGVLQAWEIYSQLKLRAELVVLSACETGRGENVRGEGIIGLTRALQYAGARSIVASHWKVADASTSTLMVAFHRKLREGLAKDEALRQAMAVVRSIARTAHPYYWAAFFLTGDPDNPNLGRRTHGKG